MSQTTFLKRATALALMALMALGLLAGCARKQKEPVTSAAQLNDRAYTVGVPQGASAQAAVEQALPKTRVEYYQAQNALLVRDTAVVSGSANAPLESADFGVMTGSTAEAFLSKTYPQAKISTYSGIADAFVALSAGKIDYVLTAYTTALNAVRTDPGLAICQKDVINESVAIAVTKENTALLGSLNEVLSGFQADGTLDTIIANWTTQGRDYVVEDIPKSDGANGILRVAIAADREPMCFVLGERYRGIDCELIERMAYELHMTVEYQNMSFSSLIAALKSGKADVIISNMTPTAERAESVGFTDPYFDNPQVLVARKGIEAARYGVTGIVAQDYVSKTYPGASISMYPSADAALLALRTDKVDAIMTSRATAGYMMKGDAALSIAQDDVVDEACYIAFPKGSALLKSVDSAISQLRADGTLDELTARWTEAEPDDFEAADIPEAEGKNGTLKVALSPDAVPICFLLDGAYAGIDVELVERIALLLDRKVEFITMDFDALLPALKSGKADMALSDMNATAERREAADFSQAYFDNPQVFLTRQAGEDTARAQVGFWEGLEQSFIKNFITDNRWKLIVKGLEVTVMISIASGVAGSILGFAICMARRFRNRLISGLTAAFIRIIQGTPIVVFLMILYYVIFQPLRNMPAEVAAVIGFSINFGVYVSEMMRTGLDAVDRGQIEAANALGYNKYQTFRKIAFPQAARHFLPVFKGEFIGMVKMTSVVGYIAIQDLTKVSDIIRSSTLDAFFPLIATAVLYFIVANLLILLLSHVELGLDPKRRPRRVKGVREL